MCLSRGVSASSDCPVANGAPLSRHADQRQVMALKLVGVATHATPSFPEGCMVFRDADAAGPQWGRAGVNVPHAQAQSLSRHMRTLRQGGRHRALFPSQGDQPTCLVNRANRPTKDIQIRQTEGRGGAISRATPHNLAIAGYFRRAIAMAQGLIAPLVLWVFPQVTHGCVKERKDAGQPSGLSDHAPHVVQ